MPAFDVFALTSKSEGLPLVVPEAMAAERERAQYDPDDVYTAVRDLAGQWTGADPSGIIAAHGIQALARTVAAAFLADGDKVKATIFFRGRELAHPEIGRRILERLIADLGDLAIAEASPRQEGNQMHVILSARAGRKNVPKARTPETAGARADDDGLEQRSEVPNRPLTHRAHSSQHALAPDQTRICT